LYTSQQKVKTLRATFTYQDVATAPDLLPDHSEKILGIFSLPARSEILSIFIRVTEEFELPSNPTISGQIVVFDFLGQEISSLTLANLSNQGLFRQLGNVGDNAGVYDFDNNSEVRIKIQMGMIT
jgi:hypothetical protein